ncbi:MULTISPECIES: DUF6904 family protein [unclassified Butyrivibrio]|uniref:DUF6904 family protein n=1 Tax=unclassified Butyrivibrio TaxID=2639466 RepID=UPI0003B6DCB6|nr:MULTISPECIES: hypothetical protein [unclassified Butyrivibrio]MDC7292051.1 hypothetical protein [Butyrivibrio sp. DSM 10294]
MIYAKPTENLTGVCVEGEFQDFYELVDSIYSMTGPEDSYDDPYWGVKNRLLGVCYDIRHAYQGDREILFADNNVTPELQKWHGKVLPKENVHYSVNILFPEAVFVALSVEEMFAFCRENYEIYKNDELFQRNIGLHDYIKDQALIKLFSGAVLKALGDVIGPEGFKSIYKEIERAKSPYNFEHTYFDYITYYVDKCNLEYLKTDPAKRPDKIRNIAKRFVKPPESYFKLKRDFEYSAKIEHCSIYELAAPEFENYPEEIVW